MSHITDVKMKIRDLDALEEAVKELGLELRRDQKTYGWYGRFVNDSNRYGDLLPSEMGKCEHAIALKGSGPGGTSNYEIGIRAAKDGDGFSVYFDSWGSGQRLEAAAGKDLSRLKQEYAIAVARRKAEKKLKPKGFTIERMKLDGGRVRLRMRKR